MTQKTLNQVQDLCSKFHRELDELLEHNDMTAITNNLLEEAARALDGPLDYIVKLQRDGQEPKDPRDTLEYMLSIHDLAIVKPELRKPCSIVNAGSGTKKPAR